MLYLRRKTKWKINAEDTASKSILRYAKDDDIAKSNYEYNSTIDLSKYEGKYINDQNTGPVSQLKFGNRQMYYNGCEIIATYNAMRTLGKPEDIRDIAYEYEKDGKMLGGEFGTNPYAAQRYKISADNITVYFKVKEGLSMKIKICLIVLILSLLLTSCTSRYELRPKHNSDEIWVCNELDDTYFYWDEETEIFRGVLSYESEVYDFIFSESPGLSVSLLEPEVLTDTESRYREYEIISGFADYQKSILPIEIESDPKNIFNGNIKKITFLCCDREEYFKNLNPENAE